MRTASICTHGDERVRMKPFRLLLATWALAGCGAVIGSMLGHRAGQSGLFAGALVGGILGVVVSVTTATRLQWLTPDDRWGALVGGLAGFGIAAPIAAANLHTPVVPFLVCSLAGAGMLLGTGLVRGWRGKT